MTGRIPVTGQLPDEMVSGLAGWRILGAGALKIFLIKDTWALQNFFMRGSGTVRSWPVYMLRDCFRIDRRSSLASCIIGEGQTRPG